MIYLIVGSQIAILVLAFFKASDCHLSGGPVFLAKQLLGGVAMLALCLLGALVVGGIVWALIFVLPPALSASS